MTQAQVVVLTQFSRRESHVAFYFDFGRVVFCLFWRSWIGVIHIWCSYIVTYSCLGANIRLLKWSKQVNFDEGFFPYWNELREWNSKGVRAILCAIRFNWTKKHIASWLFTVNWIIGSTPYVSIHILITPYSQSPKKPDIA